MQKVQKNYKKITIRQLAADPDKLAIQERSYIVAMSQFHEVLEHHRELLSDLKTFSPLLDYIKEIEAGLDEGMGWILDYLDEKIEYLELVENLEEYTADALQDNLLELPILFRVIPQDSLEYVENILDDIENLNERLCKEIQDKGFELYHVLIGAA